MSIKLNLFSSAVTALCLASGANAAIATHGGGNVEFTAIGKPSAIKIHGEGAGLESKLSLNDKSVSGKFAFPMSQLDTGIEMRTKHMKENYLEVAKYPNADLEITNLLLPQSPAADGFSAKQIPFNGMLTFHGVTKPVQGHFDAETKSHHLTGSADFEIKTTDFGMQVPKYMGITMADAVQVHVKFDSPVAETK